MTIKHELAETILRGSLSAAVYMLQGEAITLHDVQNWLRKEHDIHIVIDREGLDSDEMCYVYTITYLKPEDKGNKHWVGALTRLDSFHGYGSTYGGGWGTYEQAHEAAIVKALTLV